ncbi:hypothetical protein CTEN210_15158 [Chaetoceros tenuissimus]|uniref:Pre-mRNA-splicing factor 38 n=1 Tax=Chaetoceros tenuissimus TaxID=426638 RepID=A0AAD3HCE3_9STRA|nr:hypothetical protein CTEN210_15158 [Chaetoceros tenuissimus]
MANVTDPLARPIHGTNPQNLIEYITRQRIYDSQYWKEQLFGCTATDVAEKAASQLTAIGGVFGGNAKPTRFLCLILKLLQIQPDDEIVDELIKNDSFKYIRALGAFYLRLTGRPSDIYEKLEVLYADSRKLKYRNPSDWSLIHMDEFIDQLLTEDRVCGIALPRLPSREVLVESGYLEGPRISPISKLLGGDSILTDLNDQDIDINSLENEVEKIQNILIEMVKQGNKCASEALSERGMNIDDILKTEKSEIYTKEKGKKKSKSKFGTLFKVSTTGKSPNESKADQSSEHGVFENSDEYWNDERAKLGLKPLRK